MVTSCLFVFLDKSPQRIIFGYDKGLFPSNMFLLNGSTCFIIVFETLHVPNRVEHAPNKHSETILGLFCITFKEVVHRLFYIITVA